ncbi:uncharacterized protein LOC126692222 [Quercus robur]|uniref:uncharacterized protein LOC126692222 n=1 Tax=Quercus robur TaxID=38942 RepID=UPI0021614BA0|nr:uncharacterized protein LOC126692222 [Quercus robur]
MGGSGGILLMWDNRVVDKVDEAVGCFSVSCKFKNVADHFVWAFTGVYGPNSDRDRRFLWEELSGLRSWWDVPWCVGGDFNVVRFPFEHSGIANFSSTMLQFSDFISEQSLVNLPLVGGNFTWCNSREVVASSKLDRFLLSVDWEEKFPSVCQCRLPKLMSNHFPILLEGGKLHGGKKPFRFENMWLKDEGFLGRVSSWWESYHFQETPSFSLANKLKMLKLDLKRWNVEEFGNIGLKVQNLWKDLKVLEVIEEVRALTVEERREKDRIHGELEKSILLEEICWRQLYSKNVVHRPILDEVVFSSIFEEDATWLDRPFDEDEVFGVSTVKTDVMNVLHVFHAHVVFEKSLNATFLALIPKKFDAMDVQDYRPISLVGGMYKIIAKVQSIEGGVLGVLCNLDIEKAYDHVNWEFLMFLLQQCGFSEKWRRWIRCCISTIKFSILTNGCPSDFFGSSRGLRQGDHLSPFLFDIVMEALSRMLGAATATGQFSGFTFGNEAGSLMSMSHLLFADDTLVFCDADSTPITALRGILSRFEEMLGLRINLGKFELVPIGDVPNFHELVEILGCRESTLLLKYLGLPLGASFKDKSIWNPILEKME